MFSGIARYTAAGRSVSASLNALRNISGIASGDGTPSDHRVIGVNIATRSTYWWDSLYSRFCPTCAEIATSGVLLVVASATPSCMLIAPGPSVAETTAGRPVTRPYISAMNAAPCSCLHSTYRICSDRASARTKWMFSSPGMPKTSVTPSASRHSTISSAGVGMLPRYGRMTVRLTGSAAACLAWRPRCRPASNASRVSRGSISSSKPRCSAER